MGFEIQYLKYMESSRNNVNLQNVRAVMTAMEACAVNLDSGFTLLEYWQAVNAFEVDDTADHPDNCYAERME